MAIEFRVTGKPEPQGSTRAFTPKGWTRPIITSANPNLKDWRKLVASAAPSLTGVLEGPVSLSLVFDLPRPKSLPKRVTDHLKKPDLDKLVRACKDALTGVVWRDDSQVVRLSASKRYAAGSVGVSVLIEEVLHG